MPRRYIRGVDEEIRALAERVSRRLVEQGAKATLLTGSHARGNARPDSDVDVFAVGEGPSGWMEVADGRLVSVYWWSAEETRRRMLDPEFAVLAVRAWRDGILLDDPTGVGVELQREANEWTWEKIEREADAWVAEKLAVWAEYVMKLAAAVGANRRLDAGAIRAQLVVELAELFAVRRRVVEESENGFWETLADLGGGRWRTALERALLDGDEEAANAGVVELFTLLVEDTRESLDERQQAVVAHGLAAADASGGGSSRSRG
jgi:predicted nucleotidyltransferase